CRLRRIIRTEIGCILFEPGLISGINPIRSARQDVVCKLPEEARAHKLGPIGIRANRTRDVLDGWAKSGASHLVVLLRSQGRGEDPSGRGSIRSVAINGGQPDSLSPINPEFRTAED